MYDVDYVAVKMSSTESIIYTSESEYLKYVPKANSWWDS
jgi:hypothetical protein